MTKHTPGPWTVFNDGSGIDQYPGIEAGKNTIVVFGDGSDRNDWQGVRGATIEQAQANALLIAAAPDMFDALDELNMIIPMTAFKYAGEMAVLKVSVDKARAAIAKALGGTP